MSFVRAFSSFAVSAMVLAASLMVAAEEVRAADAPAKIAKPAPAQPSLKELMKHQKSYEEEEVLSPELEAKADADDAFSSRVDAPDLILNMSGASGHGVRERIRQRGVFAEPACAKLKKNDPSCYCASFITIPVFSKRVYPLEARPLNYNVWEAMDDDVDTPQCPLSYTQKIENVDPESVKDTAKLVLFQRIEVPLYNKEFISLVFHTYEREGKEVLDVRSGMLVDVKRKRPVRLPAIVGVRQDAKLAAFVNAELKKQDAQAEPIEFDAGESDDVDGYYLAPEGLVLQFAGGNVSAKPGTLRVVIPAEMIVHPGARQLVQPQG
jgi:hypothetical protein